MAGSDYEPVIRVNCPGIYGEGQECARNSRFLWQSAKDGNAATPGIPVLQSVLTISATKRPFEDAL